MGKGKKKMNLSGAEIETRRIQKLAADEAAAVEQLQEARQRREELLGGEPEQVEELPANIDDPRLLAFIDDMAETAKFYVYRDSMGKRMSLGSYPISQWPDRMELLARECGGGDFEVHFRGSDPTNPGQLASRKMFSFDPIIYKKPDAPKENADSGLAVMLAKMQELQMNMAQQSRAEMMELMKLMLAGGQQQKNLISSMSELQAAKAIFGGNDKSLGPKEVIELIRTGMELAGETGGGSDSGSALLKLGTKLIETLGAPMAENIAKAVTAAAPRRAGALPKLPHAPDGLETPPAPEAPKVEDDVLSIRNHIIFKTYAPALLAAAEAKADAGAYAAQLLDMVPESYDAKVLEIVSRPDVVEFAARYEPKILAYRSWFWEFAQAVKDSYEDEPHITITKTPVAFVPVPANGAAEVPAQ